ncbi:hypothetical protein D4Q80_04915 [bacterium]|nr:MAG: hypothetical protein D4Q80_04915 [bacterium]
MDKKKSIKNNNNIEQLIEFLTLTKEGKFVPIEECSFPCARVEEETEIIDSAEEIYYYNLA